MARSVIISMLIFPMLLGAYNNLALSPSTAEVVGKLASVDGAHTPM
jgi:hypothetical protein